MNFLEELNKSYERQAITKEIKENLSAFYQTYSKAIMESGGDVSNYTPLLCKFISMIEKQLKHPYQFEPYHHRITEPFDYYHYCLDFLRPLIIFEKSSSVGEEYLNEIDEHLKNGENVIFLANHQTEPDPQAISFLLEKSHHHIAEQMIFVAGHRVTTDPLAVPFSLGRNLLCIYSKKHIEHLPEKKMERMRHNQRTMQVMEDLLREGSKCIYVAPSGGRDRANESGQIEVAKFDAQSIEMFKLIAERSKTRTHFYPLSLFTYHLLPPPSGIEKNVGEQRHTKSTPIHMAVGKELDMENFPHSDGLNKKEKRIARADYIHSIVKENYDKLLQPK
ncbi:MAG: 1-acyl-sn-glycerol-3-phosphate acyltransferase [Chlamydiota bacterium]|nr:1-acyl-sn-glycerol-3-phosphate acyltransferase [Chlamydiota bacterium]